MARKTSAHLLLRLRSSLRPEAQELIIAALNKRGALAARDIARELGYSEIRLNGTIWHLGCLVDEGVIDVVDEVDRRRIYALVERGAR